MADPVAFGRYVLLEKLASGGMAEIFLAKAVGEAGFEKTCVVKRVLPHLAAIPDFVEMFLDEARIAARLVHPGIVQIFDLGKQSNDYYFAMEYLAGEDVGALLRGCAREKLEIPIDLALKVAGAAAEALHYAHDLKTPEGAPLNIVHRDVTPSNLFLTYQGAVKVLDFGIARAEQRLQETRVGQVKGKAAYMSPEQALGKSMDRRADIWSLGVCLYEMLVGGQLFVGINRQAVFESVQQARIPPPSEHRRDITEDVDALVMGMLRRDASQRTPTAERVREEIESALRDRTYVSQTSQIGAFLRQVFGENRAATRLALSAAPLDLPRTAAAAPAPGPRTESISGPDALAAPTAKTEVSSAGGAVPRRRGWRLPAAIGLVLVAGTAVGTLPWWRRTQPPPPLEAPAQPRPAPGAARAETAPRPEEPAPPRPESPTRAPPLEPQPPSSPPERNRGRSGFLSIESNQPAVAYLDATRLGWLPVRRVRATAGEHKVRLENTELGLSRTVRLFVRPGEELARKETFQKGLLNVTVSPWADVFMDGVKLGQTPLVRQVWEGRHAVRLVGPAGEKTLTVEVTPGHPAAINERLER